MPNGTANTATVASAHHSSPAYKAGNHGGAGRLTGFIAIISGVV
jgi:hypothetical protein